MPSSAKPAEALIKDSCDNTYRTKCKQNNKITAIKRNTLNEVFTLNCGDFNFFERFKSAIIKLKFTLYV